MEFQTTEYKQQWNDNYLAYISCFANTHRETFYVIKMMRVVHTIKQRKK